VGSAGGFWPLRVRIALDLPLLPVLLQRCVELLPQRLEPSLPLVPDDVDLGVASDRLEGDVRDALVDEALTDAPVDRLSRLGRPTDLSLLGLALARVGEEVVGIPRPHDSGTGERERHPRGVDRDPTTPPLLRDSSCRAGAAGRIEDEVTRISGHE
jgi:hypothetical protein